MTPENILKANLWSYFLLNGKVYQIVRVMGQAFICYEYSEETKGIVGAECVISARMVLGTTELTPFQS